MDREETLVAHELATSSNLWSGTLLFQVRRVSLTGTVVEGVQQGKEGADGENVGVGVEHLEGW